MMKSKPSKTNTLFTPAHFMHVISTYIKTNQDHKDFLILIPGLQFMI